MTALLILAATLGLLAAAGALYVTRALRRDQAAVWHPGDPVPDVPADAPLRTWHAARQRQATEPATTRRAPAPVR